MNSKKAKRTLQASATAILKVGIELPSVNLPYKQDFLVGLCDLELKNEAIYCVFILSMHKNPEGRIKSFAKFARSLLSRMI